VQQNIKIIRNDVGASTFFKLEKKFPFYSMDPIGLTPELVFSMNLKLG
jgi:hypothetical protein